MKIPMLTCLTLAMAAAGVLTAAPADTISHYALTYRATAETLDGRKLVFVATGPGTWNETTGQFDYNVSVADGPLAGDAISASGTFAAGEKKGFGSSTFNGGNWQGTAVIAGKFNPSHTRFTGTIEVGIPNRLGPAPAGFVHATGKLVMTKTTN